MIEPAYNSPNESWAYKSVMSIARPSWIEDSNEEETVHVRISVGSNMGFRTAALGSLDGHGKNRVGNICPHSSSSPYICDTFEIFRAPDKRHKFN